MFRTGQILDFKKKYTINTDLTEHGYTQHRLSKLINL